MNNLCGRFIIPWDQTAGIWIRHQNHVITNFIQNITIVIFTSYRLTKNIFWEPQAARILCRYKFTYRQDFAARYAGDITNQTFDFGDGLITQPFLHIESHILPYFRERPETLFVWLINAKVCRGLIKCNFGNSNSLINIISAKCQRR